MDPDNRSIALRPAIPADRFAIRRWLGDPEVEKWWGNRARAEAEITLAMESPSALCRIIELASQPIGYAHAVDTGLWDGELPALVPAGCWDLDILIGSPSHRGKGVGRHAVQLLASEVFSTTLAVACCVVTSIRNEAAVRAYERAGFRWAGIWQDPSFGPCWLLLKERPAKISEHEQKTSLSFPRGETRR